MTAPAARPPILNRALLLVFVASFGAMTGFYLLLSVVPLYAESVGAGGVGAGLVTGALMATTVAGELAIPRLLARFGHRAVLAAGLVLLGAPALALPASSTMAAILAVSLVRGLGFAICVVVGGALVAALVPPERRGEGLGLFGIVVGVPGVAATAPGESQRRTLGWPPPKSGSGRPFRRNSVAGSSTMWTFVALAREMMPASMDEAIKTISRRDRSPLTIDEGIALVTHFPQILLTHNSYSILGSRCGDRPPCARQRGQQDVAHVGYRDVLAPVPGTGWPGGAAWRRHAERGLFEPQRSRRISAAGEALDPGSKSTSL